MRAGNRLCWCGRPAKILTSWTDSNPGRRFWKCPQRVSNMSGVQMISWVLLMGMVFVWSEVEGLGVNWGTMATQKISPKTMVHMLKDNGINKVKLFDSEQSTISALAGTGIEVMIAIPNDQLSAMNDYDRAKQLVRRNVTRYNFNGGVNIK